MSETARQPNKRLRHEREARGWSQAYVARQLEADANIVSRWESGERKPGPYYRQKLCALFGKSAVELGLVETSPETSVASNLAVSPQNLNTHPAVTDLLYEPGEHLSFSSHAFIPAHGNHLTPDQYAGFLLARSATDLATLLQEGWSRETLLQALEVVLQGAAAMSRITRRSFVELSLASMLGGLPLSTGGRLSAEERMQLHQALGESIANGWKLFHTTNSRQVLAVGQAQLLLIQQVSSYLYPNGKPFLYAGVYNLIGAALRFQGSLEEAYQSHERAYIASLEGMNTWSMAQSRTCQANILKEQGRYSEALQSFEAALRLISQQPDSESTRLQAHLLASIAESAALLGEQKLVQKSLDKSAKLLDQLPSIPVEEFDHASWHQFAGTCALILNQSDQAIRELQRAIDMIPSDWLVRQAITLIPLSIAYARHKERDKCIAAVEKAAQVVQAMSSAAFQQQFLGYLEQEIEVAFPGDRQISTLVAKIRQQLTTPAISA